jgi:hypothetical protein
MANENNAFRKLLKDRAGATPSRIARITDRYMQRVGGPEFMEQAKAHMEALLADPQPSNGEELFWQTVNAVLDAVPSSMDAAVKHTGDEMVLAWIKPLAKTVIIPYSRRPSQIHRYIERANALAQRYSQVEDAANVIHIRATTGSQLQKTAEAIWSEAMISLYNISHVTARNILDHRTPREWQAMPNFPQYLRNMIDHFDRLDLKQLVAARDLSLIYNTSRRPLSSASHSRIRPRPYRR